MKAVVLNQSSGYVAPPVFGFPTSLGRIGWTDDTCGKQAQSAGIHTRFGSRRGQARCGGDDAGNLEASENVTDGATLIAEEWNEVDVVGAEHIFTVVQRGTVFRSDVLDVCRSIAAIGLTVGQRFRPGVIRVDDGAVMKLLEYRRLQSVVVAMNRGARSSMGPYPL